MVGKIDDYDVAILKILRYQEIVVKTVAKTKIIFLFSLYCSLLFSRKEIIKFSEVALVSVH